MIKILKWELLKEFNKLKWIFAIIFSSLFLLYIIPNNEVNFDGASLFILLLKMIIYVSFIFFTFLYPLVSLIFQLKQPYSLLERSTPHPYSKLLIVRLSLNMLRTLIGFGIFFLGIKITSDLNYEDMPSLVYNYMGFVLLYITLMYPIAIHCFYLISLTIPPLKYYPTIGVITCSVLFTIIMFVITLHASFFTFLIIQLSIIVITFKCSCLLYEKYDTAK